MSRFINIPRRARRWLAVTLAIAVVLSVTLLGYRTLWLSTSSAQVQSRLAPTLGAEPRTPLALGVAMARARAREAARRLNASRTSKRDEPTLAQPRTADISHAAALFVSHSWYVAPPPPPPVAPPPPPPPEAPPFPYTFVGSYTPSGDSPVYFLSRADRVIDAHVGDRLDGVYAFESAGSGSLVFNYLPLNIRQSVTTGVSP